jgi:hypothetical protein
LARTADANDASLFGVITPDERRRLEKLLRKIAVAHELKNIPMD